MQKVAWPTTIVSMPSGMSALVKVERRATAVTMPGSAIGSRTTNDNDSRPKNRKRATARDARVPRMRASVVAPSAATNDAPIASRRPSFWSAASTHRRLNPDGGQDAARLGLKAWMMISTIGT